MKLRSSFAVVAIAMAVLIGSVNSRAAGTTTTVVLPSMITNTTGVPMDAAPGFAHGSLKANGNAKSEAYFTPESPIKLTDIASLSYYTKKSSDHVSSPGDWYINIYTTYPGQTTTSYGARIGTEPYFAADLSETVGGWNQWVTDEDEPNNKLRFFESTYGYFGSYTDPHWNAFLSDASLAGGRGPGAPYSQHNVLSISVQTASSWGIGFTGQIDGLLVTLVDGSVMKFNMEPFKVPADRDSCKKDGYTLLKRADGSPFGNQGDCVSYVNTGK